MIKRLSIIACFVLGAFAVQAQHNVTSFYNELGVARFKTSEFSPAHDTIVMVDHRIDDIIWSRVVYRIIDMRYKQNFQLYFPTRADDPNYRNLLLVIADAMVDGMPVYEKGNTIKPDFSEEQIIPRREVPKAIFQDLAGEDYTDNPMHYEVCCSDEMLIHWDSVTDELSKNEQAFPAIARNQIKYLIQEVVFFDKHTSRLHTKIMAIAPLSADKIETTDSTQVMKSVHESIMFWIPYDQLRPYNAMADAIPSRNETKRVTYDDFFEKRLFTSYILGEGNMYNRWIPDYETTHGGIQKEQERIATELLNFEQDLWEY